MCLNCGCGQPHERHGNPANITAEDFQAAADANRQTLRESAQHVVEAVELLESAREPSAALANPTGGRGARGGGRGTPASES